MLNHGFTFFDEMFQVMAANWHGLFVLFLINLHERVPRLCVPRIGRGDRQFRARVVVVFDINVELVAAVTRCVC